MADREQPYDPYIPSGGAGQGAQGQNGNMRTAALQAVRHLAHTQKSAVRICDRCSIEKQQIYRGYGRGRRAT